MQGNVTVAISSDNQIQGNVTVDISSDNQIKGNVTVTISSDNQIKGNFTATIASDNQIKVKVRINRNIKKISSKESLEDKEKDRKIMISFET